MIHVLVIDDEEYVRLALEQALLHEGCAVTTAKNGRSGIEMLQTKPIDCVITDLRMPGLDGRAVQKWIKENRPDIDVILLTGHGDVKDAVDAIKQGAWDFLVKDTPFDGTAVTAALSKLRSVRALRRENLAAKRGGYTRDAIVEGVSDAWRRLTTQIDLAAPSQAPVLIQGETGSGKEIVARLLHERSGRAGGPFLAVNCGAVSRELLESELFGHEKGAFTGAVGSKIGLVAAAEGGTLFLDELGEMPAPMQVSLLRFLDRGEYRPVGSTRTLEADVRMVGATNQDIPTLVGHGRFREDLLYRINAVTLRVPPLRERKEDIPALARHLLRAARGGSSSPRTLSEDAVAQLQSHGWPGNIRELRNVIERLVMMGTSAAPISGEEVRRTLFAAARAQDLRPTDPSSISLEEAERLHIELVLAHFQGNKTQTAKALKIDYKTLLAKLRKYHLPT